jgi:hypothetical protein
MRLMLALLGATAVLLALISPALGAPEPEIVPKRWQLNVEVDHLRVANVDIPGVGERAFYYLTYTVTNNSGEDVQFYPAFTLATDDGKIIKSNRNVHRYAKDELHRLAARGRIELLTELDAQGLLLQGKENARESIVIWPCENLELDEVKVFLGGFSGETRAVPRPDTGETKILRKELMLTHEVLGAIDPASRDPLSRVQSRWTLR